MASRSQFRSLLWVGILLCLVAAAYAQKSDSAAPAASSQVASSPKVTYVNGLLTISAQDASLGDVLRAVSVKTGAVIEFPSDRAGEHMFANAGPGPVREVLATLLNGSRFNYVMLASPSNPSILQRMILTSSDEPAKQPVGDQPVQASEQPPAVSTPPTPELPKGLPPTVAAEAAQIDAMEPPKEPLSPDALEAMMKARREARKLQREQEASSGSSQ
ncbi:MAG: hypothetical protein WB421_13000 [Terriglobales bacterium]